MIKLDDFLDTYYFTKPKDKEIKRLAEQFPSIFTAKKKVPINFQLRFHEMTEKSTHRTADRRERVSFQNRCSKIELRRRFMTHVLQSRNQHQIFQYLCDEDDQDELIWYYIDEDRNLRGPLHCSEMQDLFEQNILRPHTQMKKKLASSFLAANYVLNKYCRLHLFKDLDRGFGQHFSSPKSKHHELTVENERERDQWLRAIGRLRESNEENPALCMSRPQSFSQVAGDKDKRMSFSFTNPKIFDQATKDTDPSELFSEKNRSENAGSNSADENNRRKRSSLIVEGNGEKGYGFPRERNFRKRVSTTTFKKSKK